MNTEVCGNDKCPLPEHDRSFMPCTIMRCGQLFVCHNFIRGDVARKERMERRKQAVRAALAGEADG